MIIELGNIFVADGSIIELDLDFNFDDVEYYGICPFNEKVVLKGEISNHAGLVTLNGNVRCNYIAPCDRCGEICSEMIDFDINYTLVQKLDNDDEKDGFIIVSEKKIDIDEVVLADLILNVPMKHLCNDDCKGLCAGCGKNLNHADCECKEDNIDPRLAALKQLLD